MDIKNKTAKEIIKRNRKSTFYKDYQIKNAFKDYKKFFRALDIVRKCGKIDHLYKIFPIELKDGNYIRIMDIRRHPEYEVSLIKIDNGFKKEIPLGIINLKKEKTILNLAINKSSLPKYLYNDNILNLKLGVYSILQDTKDEYNIQVVDEYNLLHNFKKESNSVLQSISDDIKSFKSEIEKITSIIKELENKNKIELKNYEKNKDILDKYKAVIAEKGKTNAVKMVSAKLLIILFIMFTTEFFAIFPTFIFKIKSLDFVFQLMALTLIIGGAAVYPISIILAPLQQAKIIRKYNKSNISAKEVEEQNKVIKGRKDEIKYLKSRIRYLNDYYEQAKKTYSNFKIDIIPEKNDEDINEKDYFFNKLNFERETYEPKYLSFESESPIIDSSYNDTNEEKNKENSYGRLFDYTKGFPTSYDNLYSSSNSHNNLGPSKVLKFPTKSNK